MKVVAEVIGWFAATFVLLVLAAKGFSSYLRWSARRAHYIRVCVLARPAQVAAAI